MKRNSGQGRVKNPDKDKRFKKNRKKSGWEHESRRRGLQAEIHRLMMTWR